ncbi:MAG: hypothetical protein JOZ46_04025 [Candidatus Dormibacteraeota bacterium]|nr:hypothetical protein [Candidatus Dormibacteraeota bacterium]MBV9524969.1 hypothetical protein [Candidatus Dormibacteraeota bacterium]
MGYAGASAASALLISARTDLDISFWPSALVAAHGDPLHAYSVAGQADYPNANGPLSLLPLSLVAWAARQLGFAVQPVPRAALTLAVFSMFTLLLALEAARAVRRLRGNRLDDRVPLIAAGAVLLAPPLWLATTGYGHVEMPLQLWLVLLGVRLLLEERPAGVAGMALGLALLTRSTTLLYLIAIAMFLLTNGRWRRTAITLGAAFLTAAAGIAPFLITDTSNVVHSLLAYRGALPIDGDTLWYALRDSPIAAAVQHGDTLIVAAVLVAACLGLRRYAREGRAGGERLLAMLAIAAVTFPMLAKTAFAYYMLEPFVFAAIWALAMDRAPRTSALWAPAFVLLATLIADFGVDLPRVLSTSAQGIAASAALLAALVVVVASVIADDRRLAVRRPAATPALALAGRDRELAVDAGPVVVAGQKPDA